MRISRDRPGSERNRRVIDSSPISFVVESKVTTMAIVEVSLTKALEIHPRL
jgi:hypothetical protein